MVDEVGTHATHARGSQKLDFNRPGLSNDLAVKWLYYGCKRCPSRLSECQALNVSPRASLLSLKYSKPHSPSGHPSRLAERVNLPFDEINEDLLSCLPYRDVLKS